MDPLTPTTGTLGMAVGYIAETAGGLAVAGKGRADGGEKADRREIVQRNKQKETVRWVVGTPRRLGELIGKGEKEEAERDWDEVKKIMGNWKGVNGVDELRDECERIMGRT